MSESRTGAKRLALSAQIMLLAFSLTAQQETTVSNSTKSIHQLLLGDQSELPTAAANGAPPVTYEVFRKHASLRRAHVRELLEAGQLKTGEDFHDASLIFQHGETADDYLLAHVLAVEAVIEGDDRSKWMAAATIDRYLQLIKQPQVFGTQYPALEDKAKAAPGSSLFAGRTQAPYNETLVPEAVRLDFCVPGLEQQKKNVATLNSGKYPGNAMVAPGCNR
jgi:hypothetical protein